PSWHLITGEYPPQPGGVSDYTRLLAAGLAAAGSEVHVWCPSAPSPARHRTGVTVHRQLGQLGPSHLARVGRQLDRFPRPRRLLVQWVPHAYGWQSLNVAFCAWLLYRARICRDDVQVMVHEAFLSFAGTWRQWAAATVHRFMTLLLLGAARLVWH